MGIDEDQKLTVKQRKARIVALITRLMKDEQTLHTQAALCKKLSVVGEGVSTALMSKLLNGKSVSIKTLVKMDRGLSIILREELGLRYEVSSETFHQVTDDDWVAKPIEPVVVAETPNIIFHANGRRTVQEKLAFIASAREEVVFFGLRLRQFANYFAHRREDEFATHIRELLKRGVNVKCYLVDPNSNEARLYFNDLARVSPDAGNGEESVKEVLQRLQAVAGQLKQLNYPGIFTVQTYRHLPSVHYLIVDGGQWSGRLMVSHYLYGQPASKVPVLEVHRRGDNELYELYYEAFLRLTTRIKS